MKNHKLILSIVLVFVFVCCFTNNIFAEKLTLERKGANAIRILMVPLDSTLIKQGQYPKDGYNSIEYKHNRITGSFNITCIDPGYEKCPTQDGSAILFSDILPDNFTTDMIDYAEKAVVQGKKTGKYFADFTYKGKKYTREVRWESKNKQHIKVIIEILESPTGK